MSSSRCSLSQLGWRAHFSQQLSLEDLQRFTPARVVSVQRSLLTLWSELGESHIPTATPGELTGTIGAITVGAITVGAITVGDWVLVDPDSNRIERLIERSSLLARMAAGTEHRMQPIAANLDTLFVVTSCNEDFNASRLERYLSIAHDARIDTTLVLTKRDLCEDIDELLTELKQVAPNIPAIAVNATDLASARSLLEWLTPAATIAFVGSSGVGKSTLVNTLTGAGHSTGSVREQDSKGRHTTTSRQMVPMPGGAWLIDTPGMRELKVGAVAAGIRATFDDVETLARNCRFRNCQHRAEIECAVLGAVAAGKVSERRLENYLKLQREAQRAMQTVFERREQARRFGKMGKAVQAHHRKNKGKR